MTTNIAVIEHIERSISEEIARLDSPSRSTLASVAAGIEDRLIQGLVLERASTAELEPLIGDISAVQRELPLAIRR